MQKIFQYFKPHGTAFFRVELAGKHIALLRRRVHLHAIVRYCFYNPDIVCLQIIRMYKIYIRIIRHAFKKPSVILQGERIVAAVSGRRRCIRIERDNIGSYTDWFYRCRQSRRVTWKIFKEQRQRDRRLLQQKPGVRQMGGGFYRIIMLQND